MKKLSEYTGIDAIDLWADIYDAVDVILSDKEILELTTGKITSKNLKSACRVILKKHPQEAEEILEKVGGEPVTGTNAYQKLFMVVTDLVLGDSSPFSRSSGQEISEEGSSGSATENTEGGVK